VRVTAFVLVELAAALALLFLSRQAADPRQERTRSLWFYLVFVLMALPPPLLLPLGHGPNVAFFGAVGIAAWIGLGALWVARRNPSIPNPDWLMRPWWIPDWTLLVITALCAVATFFG
jgi:hypothetical protein